jgi:hypothetical protein
MSSWIHTFGKQKIDRNISRRTTSSRFVDNSLDWDDDKVKYTSTKRCFIAVSRRSLRREHTTEVSGKTYIEQLNLSFGSTNGKRMIPGKPSPPIRSCSRDGILLHATPNRKNRSSFLQSFGWR